MTFRFRYLAVFLTLLLGGSFIFFQPYNKVRQQAIDAANAEQEILGRQAALGIEDFLQLLRQDPRLPGQP